MKIFGILTNTELPTYQLASRLKTNQLAAPEIRKDENRPFRIGFVVCRRGDDWDFFSLTRAKDKQEQPLCEGGRERSQNNTQ